MFKHTLPTPLLNTAELFMPWRCKLLGSQCPGPSLSAAGVTGLHLPSAPPGSEVTDPLVITLSHSWAQLHALAWLRLHILGFIKAVLFSTHLIVYETSESQMM